MFVMDQFEKHRRLQTHIAVLGDAHTHGDLIGYGEIHAAAVGGKEVGIALHHLQRRLAVLAAQLHGKLNVDEVLDKVESMGFNPKEIFRTVERKHIFTHIEWHMRGVYLEVKNTNTAFIWMTPEQINHDAALPTAFRQFWEEII